jgi:hypothetical protein
MRRGLLLGTLITTTTALLFAATWHFFWTRPDWADRFLVEPLESRYWRASISSLDSFTLRLLLKGAASTFAKAQIALAKVAITYSGWRRPLKVAGCLAADGGELPLFCGLD